MSCSCEYYSCKQLMEIEMEAQGLKLVNDFLNREEYTIPLVLVSEAVGASNKDITNWRQRDLLVFPAEKINGRYMVTRDGAIALGVMSEIAWLVGPETAAGIAKAIFGNFFARSPLNLDILQFRDTVVYFRKPSAARGAGANVPRFPGEDEDTWDAIMGFPLRTATADMLARQPIPNHTTVVLPIGQCVCQWALHIELSLSKA